jgi:hypothetical protein
MQKNLMKQLLSILLLLSLYACNTKRQQATTPGPPADSAVTPATIVDDTLADDTSLLPLSNKILTLLKNKDYTSLGLYFHPVAGTRFSPYGFIDTNHHVIFFKKTFIEQQSTNKKIYWGNYDGSGDSILLSVEKYFEKFVYNADFLNAEKTSINKITGTGNSLNNLQSVYPGAVFTESYFSGFDKKYGGMDWCSLRLVYKKYKEQLYLVAIVHDQWTI